VNPQAILFDAGNTLVEIDYPYVARAIVAAGGDATADDVRQAERRARVPLDTFLAGAPTETPDVFQRYVYLVFDHLSGTPPREPDMVFEALAAHGNLWSIADPEAAPTLALLRDEGYRLGVVSNSDGTVERILERLGLRGFLEVVIDSEIVGIQKPDPAIFGLALEALGVDADRAVYLGDIPSVDLDGARAAGMTGVLMDPLGLWAGWLPDPRVAALSDLPEILRSL